jgi:flagellar biosynthesis/type III secretory pathway M-ring protein FliF/YscJ
LPTAARSALKAGPISGAGFFDFVKSLGAAQLAAMGAVTLALVGFFSFLMIRMTTPQMVPLFTDLSVEDSASIVKDLERQAIAISSKATAPSWWWPRRTSPSCV